MKRLVLIVAALALCGCSDQKFHLIYGPAQFNLGSTIYTPGLNITIDEDGVIWIGPEKPTADVLGWIEQKNGQLIVIEDEVVVSNRVPARGRNPSILYIAIMSL